MWEGCAMGKGIPAVELDDDLAGTVVVDFLEFANVAYGERRKC